MKFVRSLGLMSGTSMDGLDCGLFDIYLTHDYNLEWVLIDFETIPYSKEFRNILDEYIYSSNNNINDLDQYIGKIFLKYVAIFLKGRNIDIIASHGQTIAHKDGYSSTQIGNPMFMYNEYNVPIIYNFRQADIDMGGNGAPLMPFLDWLLFKDNNRNIITLNIGGVANISYINKSGIKDSVVGFDTGPGMALIDEACHLYLGKDMDLDGINSSKGKVDQELLNQLILTQKFIHKNPPKSTGRDIFGANLVKNIYKQKSDITMCNLLRTLCAFTAKSIAINLEMFLNLGGSKFDMIVSGGGINHPIIMNDIQKYISSANIKSIDDCGIHPNMKESLLMAVLGVARFQNIPANMPSVTGARRKTILGDIFTL